MNVLRRFLPSGLGGLAGLACALCCVIPLLLAAGILGGTTWALLGQILPGIALGLAALTGLAFWCPNANAHTPPDALAATARVPPAPEQPAG